MPRAALLVLAVAAGIASCSAQQCGGSACIVTATCGSADNTSTWNMLHQTIDAIQATNIKLVPSASPMSVLITSVHQAHLTGEMDIINCAGYNSACHAWAPGFGDRNGVFQIVGALNSSFVIQSFQATKTMPVGPNQTPAGD